MANQEIERRRTFAIIAHPDAGKTSLTEKLLLFGGQIQVAGVEADAEFRPSGQFDDVQKFGGGRVESGDAQRPIQPPSTR